MRFSHQREWLKIVENKYCVPLRIAYHPLMHRRKQKQLPSEAKANPNTNGYRRSNVTLMEIDCMAGMGRNNGPQNGITLGIDGFLQGTNFPNGKPRKPTGNYMVLSHRQAKWLRDRITAIIG